MTNPFTITFGQEPASYIIRGDDSSNIIRDLNEDTPLTHMYMITGPRGCGKTVLLGSIFKHFKSENNWVTILLNSSKDLLEGLASSLYDNPKARYLFLEKEFSFSFHGFSFSLKGKTPVLTIETLIEKMLDKIKAKNMRVLIAIDEVVSDSYMKIFAKTFQNLLVKDYPVFLLMTSLYDNISKLQDEKSLTFLYRAPKVYLSPLNYAAIANSYKSIFSIDDKTALDLTRLTKGYAYAYQVLGYLLFKSNKKNIDSQILSDFDQYLQEYVYEKMWSELSKNDQLILKAIGDNEIITIKEILKKTGMTNSYFSSYRKKLIKSGILISPGYGLLQFALPRFNEYIKFMD